MVRLFACALRSTRAIIHAQYTGLTLPVRYRKIAGDRSEKNMRYAPAAVEMSGVAALMLDYMRKDIDTELERAYSMYQRTNQPRLWCASILSPPVCATPTEVWVLCVLCVVCLCLSVEVSLHTFLV